MTQKAKEITKEDWRHLGFFYSTITEEKKWVLTGSPYGLKAFILILNAYVKDPTNKSEGEHIHIGPYGYLKVETRKERSIDKNRITGNSSDINELSKLIEKELIDINIGKRIKVGLQYIKNISYDLELDIREYGFDPATMDSQLWINES